jgi:hypothetical protein
LPQDDVPRFGAGSSGVFVPRMAAFRPFHFPPAKSHLRN